MKTLKAIGSCDCLNTKEEYQLIRQTIGNSSVTKNDKL